MLYYIMVYFVTEVHTLSLQFCRSLAVATTTTTARSAATSVTLPPGKHISFLCALSLPERLVNSTDATPSTLHSGIITEALPKGI